MARPEGLEPPTYGFGSRHSIQMSYERITLDWTRREYNQFVQDCHLPILNYSYHRSFICYLNHVEFKYREDDAMVSEAIKSEMMIK